MRALIQFSISDFERDNAELTLPLTELLDRFCSEPQLHARFMNTLAMMEHIGSHKIMATQGGRDIDQPTLKHLAEEARHAFFFKRQADSMAGRHLDFVARDLLQPAFARMYFQRLEAAIASDFGAEVHARTIYLYMSMIIEFRAVWGYRLYQQALERAALKVSLKSLLAEEQGHLIDMASRLEEIGDFSQKRVQRFCAEEKRLFARLLKALQRSITGNTAMLSVA